MDQLSRRESVNVARSLPEHIIMVSYVRGRTARTMSDAEIVALYLSGLDSATVGARASCYSTTVLDLVRKAGGTVRGRGGRLSSEPLPLTDAAICELYRSGMAGPAIADKVGCAASTIYGILRRHNVKTRPSASTRSATAASALARRRGKKSDDDG